MVNAKIIGCAIRAHWGIENRAHYVRDVTLGEDARRVRTRPGVMARTRLVAPTSSAPTASRTSAQRSTPRPSASISYWFSVPRNQN